MRCNFSIYRFDPNIDKKPRYQEYKIDAEPTDKILDCLNKIRWEQDPTLAYRYSCAHGICGSDALMINGRIELACQKLVRDFKTGHNFVIEPLPLFDVVKDLIVDLEPFFEKYRQVQPYLIAAKRKSDKEFIQRAENQEFIEPALRCILCASCTAACPINRARPDYLGPAALLRAFRYIFDSRDSITDKRLEKLDIEDGIWGCKTMWWCTEVCPKEIPITKCLGQIKRAIKQKEKEGTMPEKNLLAGFSFFSDVDSDTLDAISQKGEILEFNAGDVIFHYEEPSTHFYGLLEGEVDLVLVFKDKVLKTDIEYEEAIQATMVDEEKEIIVDTVAPGQVFGWSSVVGTGKRTVTAECAEASRIISIPAAELKAMFDKDHTLGYIVMKRLSDIIARRLRNRTDKLIETWGEAFDIGSI